MTAAWRTATGKAASLGRLVQSVTVPADEASPATPAEAHRRDHGPDGRFLPGNGIAKSKRLKSGPRGALAMLESKGDPARIAALRWGRRYGSHRRAEIARAHGGSISAGVGTIVESAADLLADARYWRAKSIETSDPELSRLAAQLMAQARGCERDAWELASRENAARVASEGSDLDQQRAEFQARLAAKNGDTP